MADSGRFEAVKVVFALALPVLAENFLAMFVGWSDSILTGRVLAEERYLAAVGVGGYLLWFLESCAALVSTGSLPIVSRLVGANQTKEANAIVMQALILALLLGLGLMALGRFAADSVTRMLNMEPDAQQLAVIYLRIVSLSCPGMMVMLIGTSCLRAAGHTFAGMIIMTIVNALNIVFSWTLTCGVGPFKGWGWEGVAWGTAASFLVGGLVTLVWLTRGYGDLKLPWQQVRLDVANTRRILRIGVAGGTNSTGVVLCHLWFIAIIGKLGTTAMAAHIVAIRCESLGWLTADAFAIAIATLVGQSLGKRRRDLARLYGWLGFIIGCSLMSLLGLVFFVAAGPLIGLFVDPSQGEVIEQGVSVLKLVSFTMPALAASVVFTGAMRGAGDTRWPLLYNTVGLLLIRIPLAYLFVLVFPWGLYGAWMAMFIDLYARGIASTIRFLSAGWTLIEV